MRRGADALHGNPLMIPVLGSYFIANLPTFSAGKVSDTATLLMKRIRNGDATARASYWNPMITQQDIHRAIASPLSSATCTPQDLQAVIPGFNASPARVALPRWTDKTYIEGWTLGRDFIPYYTRVCYLWTDHADSKQQTCFIGWGRQPGRGTYFSRTDTCLNTESTMRPYFEWDRSGSNWVFKDCLQPNPPVGLPYPDWIERDDGVVKAQILGNPNFGLTSDETLNLIAAQLRRGGGELAIFWLGFLGNGVGLLFSEGNYLNPLSHNLQVIDYNLFSRNADLTQNDFPNPCASIAEPSELALEAESAHGHLTRFTRLRHIAGTAWSANSRCRRLLFRYLESQIHAPADAH